MFNLKQIILAATAYVSGYVNKDDKYVISCSMLGNTPLQNYLSIMHGKLENADIDDSTLGSIFHRGMQEILIEKQIEDMTKNGSTDIYAVEHSMSMELPNGWILSGTGDLISNPSQRKYGIHDHKLAKYYAATMVKKELRTHGYVKQLHGLDLLFRTTSGQDIDGPIDLYIEFFAKEAKKAEHQPTYQDIKVPNREDTSTVAEIVAQTDSLQAYLESGEAPPECSKADRWIRNIKGTTIATRCAFYCAHGKAGLCPYYKVNSFKSVEKIVGW